MACVLALIAVAEGKSPTKCPLAEINSKWMDKTITVKNAGDAPNVMQLLKAFHAVWRGVDCRGRRQAFCHERRNGV